MNLPALQNNQTMSSLEIADMTGKDHAHVTGKGQVWLEKKYRKA